MTITGELTGLEMAYRAVFVCSLIFLAVMVLLCLIRAVKGPRVADRIVAVNMMGTMVMVMIAILALLLKEGYLVDICIIYAMISFLAVIVLTKVYMGVHKEHHPEDVKENVPESVLQGSGENVPERVVQGFAENVPGNVCQGSGDETGRIFSENHPEKP